MLPSRIQIIGEGNVAFHLTSGICCIPGVKEIKILSRSKKKEELFKSLSDKIKCGFISEFEYSIPLSIIAVSDDALNDVIAPLKGYEHLLVHTSGSTDIALVKQHGLSNYGVIYPLQTFSINKEITWPEVPFFITANSPENEQYLVELCRELSSNVRIMNDEQRLSIHIAAVFVNNFTNQLFTLADQWLVKNQLEFDILKPLISETINKLNKLSPYQAQTGPAVRADLKVIEKHKQKLSHERELSKIYELMTMSIIESHKDRIK